MALLIFANHIFKGTRQQCCLVLPGGNLAVCLTPNVSVVTSDLQALQVRDWERLGMGWDRLSGAGVATTHKKREQMKVRVISLSFPLLVNLYLYLYLHLYLYLCLYLHLCQART